MTAEPELAHHLRELERVGWAGIVGSWHVAPADEEGSAEWRRGRDDLLEDLAEPLDPLHAGELLRSPFLTDLGVDRCTLGRAHRGAACLDHGRHGRRLPEVGSAYDIVDRAVAENAEATDRVATHAFGGEPEFGTSPDGRLVEEPGHGEHADRSSEAAGDGEAVHGRHCGS